MYKWNIITFFFYISSLFLGEAFYHLDAPVIRITGVDTPMPYTKTLEIAALPQMSDVVFAVNKVLGLQ